jgi:hypothetical protein
MTNISLYQATALAQLQNFVDEDGVINIEAFNNSQIALADKQKAVVAYIRNLEVNKAMLQAAKAEMLKPIDTELKRIDTHAESLKSYLALNMKSAGINEIKADNGTFKAVLYVDRDESVEWLEGVTVPDEFVTVKEVKTPSKTLVRAAIEKGEPVACARIVKKDRLTIN